MTALVLGIGYLAPVVLLALLLAGGHNGRWRPAVTVVLLLLPLFYIAHYLGLQAIQGWPSNAPVPDEFQLLAFEVTEPERKNEHPGEILLWLRAAAGEPPRVHRLDYDGDLHTSLLEAGKRQSSGNPQQGRVERGGAAPASGEKRAGGQQIRFEDQPVLRPPPKDTSP